MWVSAPMLHWSQMDRHTHDRQEYLLTLIVLIAYSACMVAGVLHYHVDPVWLFYGLFPTAFSFYSALRSYRHSDARDREADDRQQEILAHVRLMAGADEGVKEFDA